MQGYNMTLEQLADGLLLLVASPPSAQNLGVLAAAAALLFVLAISVSNVLSYVLRPSLLKSAAHVVLALWACGELATVIALQDLHTNDVLLLVGLTGLSASNLRSTLRMLRKVRGHEHKYQAADS